MPEEQPAARVAVEYEDPAETALKPFERPAGADAPPAAELSAVEVLTEALKKVLDPDETETDLLSMEDLSALEHNEDGVARARQAYVLSYLKVLDFLRRPAGTFNERAWQARMAHQVIRHTEQHSLDRLKFGRSLEDESLQDSLREVRAEVEKLAELKARLDLARKSAVNAKVLATSTESGSSSEAGGNGTTVN